MRAERVSVEYTVERDEDDELNEPRYNKVAEALRIGLSGGMYLFIILDQWANKISAKLSHTAVPRWGDNPKLMVLREVAVSQQVVGYWISVAKLHDEATKRCLELLS